MADLERIDDNVWVIDGPVVAMYGMPFPTRMAVVRLGSGGLWLWSPIRLDDGLRRQIASLGEPRFVVEPNKLHHLALAEWVSAWPTLQLYGPPGLAKKRRDLRFIAELTEEAPPDWRGEIEQIRVEGSLAMTEVLFFHRPSSAAIVHALDWSPRRLVIAHGACVMEDGQEVLRRSLRWLLEG